VVPGIGFVAKLAIKFTVHGLVLTLMGIFGSEHIKTKAAGSNIDLWTGIGMPVFAGLMIFWALAAT
jgi:hypothetical protein